ncbi:MAG: tRNA (N6-threonylcarbamoyladenosine(37)-N6)-methyltransferase TrmO [Paludibacteraceae bacterium]|nr:tRNA (N6-threonylcarbamoyladenosine(37)-N6)-methyltransferase TrmO [Paludibacteraceae bacterium]
MDLKVIAYARNGHSDKFGIPRQSRDESPIVTRIVFEPEYRIHEALRGIEGYSHLWLIWGFDKVEREKSKVESKWSPTVRPPRLGGNTRMGVFATRSPFRPNPLGLSSVRLIKVVKSQKSKVESGSLELIVSGADLLDGTPIYDIKPYLSFSDSHEDAKNGFAEESKDYRLTVSGKRLADENLWRDIEYILSQDPRPAYQNDPDREYKLDYAGYTVSFSVNMQTVEVKKIEKSQK